MKPKQSIALAICATVALVGVTGCGSSSSSSGDEAGGGAVSAGYLAKVDKNVEGFLSPQGTFEESPTTSPTRPGGSHSIVIVSCGQQVPACKSATEAAQEAAGKLGWESSIYDTKGEYQTASAAIRNGLAQGVDGIFTYLIDCQYMKAGLEEAKKAGVPVIAAEGRDCNETEPGAPSLFTYVVRYRHNTSFAEEEEAYGRASAEYAIDQFEGKAKALAFVTAVPALKCLEEEWERNFGECAGCSLNIVRFPVSAYGTRLQGIAEQELLKNPEVNTVLPSEEAAALEVYPAVRASGKADQLLTFMGEGGEAGLNYIREGTESYAVCYPVRWAGWAAVDSLGRVFANQKPVPIGYGIQLVDAEHNLPSSGSCKSPVDFEDMYERAWGLN